MVVGIGKVPVKRSRIALVVVLVLLAARAGDAAQQAPPLSLALSLRKAPAADKKDPWRFYFEDEPTGVEAKYLWEVLKAAKADNDWPRFIVYAAKDAPADHIAIAVQALTALGVKHVTTKAGTYSPLNRALAKLPAKHTAAGLAGRTTMPPPPDEVVKKALTDGLTRDVARATHGLFEAQVQQQLGRRVLEALKDELATAAKSIAAGKLSADQIRKLQEKLRRKAFALLVAEVHRRRAKTQDKPGAVDPVDVIQERLEARKLAKAGRGQDLAGLTADGVPDTSVPLVALWLGAAKGAAPLEPVVTRMQPGHFSDGSVVPAPDPRKPTIPPRPAKWGFETQAKVKPAFKTPRFEAIPFLARFPRLDGDLSDWGTVRPLTLTSSGDKKPPVSVYAGWSYQGFFLGYHVKQPADRFVRPVQPKVDPAGRRGNTDPASWAFRGDHLHLMFDTLDARNKNRGEPHTQEFVIFPQGTDAAPRAPGIERVIASQRDGITREYRGVKSSCKQFPLQPPAKDGPDGSGPYRVTKVTPDGYTVEAFIPRSLFQVPVFAPGWHIGFQSAVAAGERPKDGRGGRQLRGWTWAARATPDSPTGWGDLLLLGTDPYFLVQNADPKGALTTAVIPGHSYLVTIVDPDRNARISARDSVIVSAEVYDPKQPPKKRKASDAELFVLRETGENTGIFRGYVNTQPGVGGQAHGVLEMLAGQTLRLGYVDLADSKGRCNRIFTITLPVVRGVHVTARPKP